MLRTCCPRQIDVTPCSVQLKPLGIRLRLLEEVILTLGELESGRLADLTGFYQKQAAERIKISRSAFLSIIEQVRRKGADALMHGKALRLEGEVVKKR